MLCFVESSNTRVDPFVKEPTRELCELKASLEYTQREVADLKSVTERTTHSSTASSRDIEKVTQTIEEIKQNVDYLENQSRRNNLRIDGIDEMHGETWIQTESLVRETLTAKLDFTKEEADSIEIERAHWVGKRRIGTHEHKPRSVVVKFGKFKDREGVIKKARETKSPGLYVNEDYSQRVIDRRKELMPAMKKAREEGKIAYLSFDKLVVRDRFDR